MRIGCVVILAVGMIAGFAIKRSAAADGRAATMEQKLRLIEHNGGQAHPDPTPTEFSEGDVNAYFASGQIDLPAGVKSVRLQGEPGVITGTTQVDFDQLKGRSSSANPLLAIFSGVHEVVVIAHAHGTGGEGFVHVDSVSLDGVEIPRFALQMFVDKYLHPKYPDIGLDSRFQLPNRIATATVGTHTLTVVQK
jgi:hypothetical protein